MYTANYQLHIFIINNLAILSEVRLFLFSHKIISIVTEISQDQGECERLACVLRNIGGNAEG